MVTSQDASPVNGILERLTLPSERAALNLENILMAAGGLLIPLALARLFAGSGLGLVVPVGIPGALPVFLAAILSLGLAAAVFFVRQLGGLRPAGYAFALSAAALFAEAASRIGDEPKGTLGVFLFIVLCAGLFVYPKSRHAVFLGGFLFASWRFLVLLVGLDAPNTLATAMNPASSAGLSDLAAGVSIALAAAHLAAVWFLDRKGAFGLALPFAAVGIVIAAFAASPPRNFVVGGLAFAVAGAAVWVGTQLGRRGVAWAGAAGLVLSMARLYDGFDSRLAGLALLVVGVGLMGFAVRTELPGMASALGSLASSKAVLPPGAQPGQPPQGQAQPFGDAYNRPGPAPAFGAPQAPTGSGVGDYPAPQFNPAGFGQDPSLSPGANQGQGPEFQAGGFQQGPDYQQGTNFEAQGDLQAAGFGQDAAGFQGPTPEPIDRTQADDLPTEVFVEPQRTAELNGSGAGVRSGRPGSAGEQTEVGNYLGADPSEATTLDVDYPDSDATGQTAALQVEGVSDDETVQEVPLAEPNWYADPTERYDHRWHDGVNWTEHVATAGNSAVDPIKG